MKMEEKPGREGNPAVPPSHFPIIKSSTVVTIIWDENNTDFTCIFCKRTTIDEIRLGPLYRLPNDGVVTHYFCMLFSSGLSQQGDDKSGILGFMPPDILKEARRAQRLKCTYCHTSGASIGCNTSRCKVSFHFPCGLANEANFEFLENYKAFCKNHSTLPSNGEPPPDRECPICMQIVKPPHKPIVGSCCRIVHYHKHCLQDLALNAGYFFKCSLCNSIDQFPDTAKLQGIFVPEQDASWEREPHAYADLYQVYNHCDADKCECPKGADYGANKGNWMLARCRMCGSAGTHRQCGKLTTIANWACAFCLEIEKRTALKRLAASKVEKKVDEPTPSTSAAAAAAAASFSYDNVKSENASNDKEQTSSSRSKTKASVTKREKSQGNATNSISQTVPILLKSEEEVTNVELKTEINQHTNRAKRTGISEKEFDLLLSDNENDDMNEDVDLCKIHIQPSCTDYFPYSAKTKKKLAKQSNCFPDWRHFYLRVNLVNIFIDAIRAETNPVKMTPEEMVQLSNSRHKKSVVAAKKKVKAKVEPPVVVTKLVNTRKTGGRKRSSRTSNWSKGMLKRRKTAVKKTTQPVLPTNNSILHVDNKVSKESSTATQSVLVGIKRSRESILQLKAQSSNKNNENVKTPNLKDVNVNGLPPEVEKAVTRGQKANRSFRSSITSGSKITDSKASGQSKTVPCIQKTPSRENVLASLPSLRITRNARRNSAGLVQSFGRPGSNDQLGSQPSNGASQHKPTATDHNGAKISVYKPNSSRTTGRSSKSSLETDITQSARDLVDRLRHLDPSEANAKLRILELNCPELFKPNLSKK